MKVYIIGVFWYSADQGDYPNTDMRPSYVETDLTCAEARYEELAKGDNEWGFGRERAYLIEMEVGKIGYHILRGEI